MRKRNIVELVNKVKEITVDDLASHFCVSVETIRRDLKQLDAQELLVRIHGGAISKQNEDIGTSLIHRLKDNAEEKRNLVKKAVSMVVEGSVIGLDASSSTYHFASLLPNINCTIVTNSLAIISLLQDKSNIHIISTGGNYSEKYGAFYGSIARDTLSKMSLDICFISCVGFCFESGIWDSNEYNCEIKKKFIEISNDVLLIADKTKFNKRSLLKICDINSINTIITDTDLTGVDISKFNNNILISDRSTS
jgi:DeoR family L-fucose operon activator